MEPEKHLPNETPSTSVKPAEEDHRRPRRRVVEVDTRGDGFAFGLDSGDTEPQTEHIAALKLDGEALGNEDWERRWDPKSKPSDALLALEHEENLRRRAAADAQILQRSAEFRETVDALASVPAAGKKPASPGLFRTAVTLVIAISVSPTLREELFASIDDQLLGWGAAVGVGVCLALTIVSATMWIHLGEE
jgi:hypothetical protein